MNRTIVKWIALITVGAIVLSLFAGIGLSLFWR